MDDSKKRKRKALGVVAAILAATPVALVACNKTEESEPPQPGPESGAYYCVVNNDEYLINLYDVDKISLFVRDENKFGTYNVTENGEITLTIGEETIGGTIGNDELRIKYDGKDMWFRKKIYYKVRFETNGGSEIEAQEVLNGKSALKPNDPDRGGGYIFVGWYSDSEYTKPFTFTAEGIMGDITLYAQWAEVSGVASEYKVKLDEGEGTLKEVETLGGKLYGLPTPERSGCTFKGWYISQTEERDKLTSKYTSETVITENTTLFAVWEEKDAAAVEPMASVENNRITWESVEGATSYSVKITGPNNYIKEESGLGQTSLNVEFKDAGSYEIEVRANNSTAVSKRYYIHKGLGRVTQFTEVEPSAIIWNAVENAEKYYVTVECGNPDHKHKDLDNGKSTYFYLGNCQMEPSGIKFTVTATAEGYASSTSITYNYIRELDEVKEVVYDAASETVKWRAVEKAAGYEVTIGSKKINTSGNSITVKAEDKGKHEITVKPVTKGYISPKGTKIEIEKKTLASPSAIEVNGNNLTWEKITDAKSYVVKVGEKTYNASTNSYDLSQITNVTTDKITVQAVGSDASESSLWSDEYEVRTSIKGTLKYESGIVSWRPVLGVSDYTVKVNGVTVTNITDGKTSAKITLTKAGDNKITVETASESAEISVYAYTVRFDTQGGSAVADKFLAIGDTVILPDTTLPGYVFNGWYSSIGGSNGNGRKYGDEMTLQSAGDTVLFVDWTPDVYTAKYDYGNGKGVGASGSLQYTKPYKLEVPTPNDVRDLFVGWFSAPTGGIRYTNELGESYNNWGDRFGVTMYAQYLRVFDFVYLENSKTYAVGKCVNSMISFAIKQITVPKSYDDGIHGERDITVIDAYAFQGCSTLESITLYDTVTLIEVDSSAFSGCSKLREINIEHVSSVKEPKYSSPNGVLVVKNNGVSELKYVPAGMTGTLNIPTGVTAISERAFTACKIQTVNIPTTVTNVYGKAFYNCADLKSINFNKNLEGTKLESIEIGDNAFYNCSGLNSISFPARMTSFNAKMFYSCPEVNAIGVESGGTFSVVDEMLVNTDDREIVYFPVAKTTCNINSTSVTSIGENAFNKATRLTAITIPSWITKINKSAFEGCKALKTVTFAGAADNPFSLNIGDSAFASCSGLATVIFANGSKVVSLGNKAFNKCTALTNFVVPNTVTSIGQNTFDGCSNIKSFTFGTEVKTVGNSAFNGCIGLTSIEIPAKLTAIGDSAFCGCTNLRNISYADRTNDGAKLSLGKNAFERCTGLTTFNIRLFITEVGSGIFTDCKNLAHVTVEEGHTGYTEYDDIIYKLDNKGAYESLIYFPYTKSGAVVLPDTLTSIGGGVFKANKNITSITIGANVEEIGANAFQNCTNIRTVTFAEGTTSLTIGAYAFSGCSKLNTINIPSRLTAIPDSFLYGTAISSIEIPATVESIGNYAFNYF